MKCTEKREEICVGVQGIKHTRDIYILLRSQATDLATLGKQLLSVSAPFEHHSSADCIAAARVHLADCETISLGNLPLLLADFKHHQVQSGETIHGSKTKGPKKN